MTRYQQTRMVHRERNNCTYASSDLGNMKLICAHYSKSKEVLSDTDEEMEMDP